MGVGVGGERTKAKSGEALVTCENNAPANHWVFLREKQNWLNETASWAWGRIQETIPVSPNKINILIWEDAEFSCYPKSMMMYV